MCSKTLWILISSIGVLPLVGCDAFPSTFFGAGASAGMQAGVSKTISSIVSQTFTAPLPIVLSAALDALGTMQINVRDITMKESGADITANTKNLDIGIQLEEISPNATRMTVTARVGAFPYDSATGAEILRQTECAMMHKECVPGPFIL